MRTKGHGLKLNPQGRVRMGNRQHFFSESGQALGPAAQGSDGVTDLGGVQEMWKCSTDDMVQWRRLGLHLVILEIFSSHTGFMILYWLWMKQVVALVHIRPEHCGCSCFPSPPMSCGEAVACMAQQCVCPL